MRQDDWTITASTAPVPFIEADASGRLRRATPHAAALLALPTSDNTGSLLDPLFRAGSITQLLNDALADGGVAILRDQELAGSINDPPRTLDLIASPQPDGSRLVAIIDASTRRTLAREIERLQSLLADAQREQARLGQIQRELTAEPPRIIGSSAPMLRMNDQVRRVGPTAATVLIHGESGSGKELVARAIHAASPRAGNALIAVNCAAMPDTLIESELFGHERGAFTGADRERHGKFELADKGTLFLDEIAELSASAQAKLLRVLQEGAFERVGGSQTIRVDVRVVAATHRDLAVQVARGRFREDLFYRLNVFRIDVPSLRDRREDIRALAEFLHDKHAKAIARPVLPISERSMRRMLAYRWPGNVRELENTIQRATILSIGPELEVELPQGPAAIADPGRDRARDGTTGLPKDVLLDLTLDQLQRLQIMHALETSGYKVFGDNGAATKLEINPQTLLSRMDKLGIPRPRTLRAAQKRVRRASGD
ncbi:MAG: sigma-54-dependent Fis family transcriptional regulator [Phycisphaerales bacterium]|nr:sigma-54-dependent Fis family transcriptional regulator [Phycisphaerales bacterium]